MVTLRNAFVACALLALGACAGTEPGAYVTPPKPGTEMHVTIGGGSTPASTAIVARRLGDAGFEITRRDPARGLVSARASGVDYIDCGSVRQVALGNTARFDGNAELAVIYRNQVPIDFFTREVSSRTSVDVAVSGDTATVSEVHAVTVLWRSADKRSRAGETRQVTGKNLVRFADNSTCTSSGRVAAVLRSG